MTVQLGLNPITIQAEVAFPALDFESQKLKAVRHMHNPGFRLIELNAKLFENLRCSRQGVLRLSSCPAGHHPVIRPPRELVPLPPHLLVEGSQQDVTQQRRDDSALRGSRWSRVFLSPLFIACLQHLLNQLQHSAISDPLSDKGQELFMIHRPEKVFQIRVHDPLVSALHYFTPNLGQGIRGLATFAISKTARIKDALKDGHQTVDQSLLTYPVVDRRYAERP